MEMNKMTRTAAFLALALAVLLHPGRASAEVKKIQKSQVPKPVLDAVAKKYPNAKMVAFESADEEGKLLYEVGIEEHGIKTDVEVSADGKIANEETTLKPSEVPAPVKAGLAASKYNGWKVNKVERVIKEEKTDDPAYEYVVTSKGKKFEVVLDKDGKVTKEEDKG